MTTTIVMTTMTIVTQATVRDQNDTDLSDALWEAVEAITIVSALAMAVSWAAF